MNNSENGDKKWIDIDSSTVLSLASGVAFLATLFVHICYCGYFNIPISLIRLSKSLIILWIIKLFFLSFGLMMVFSLTLLLIESFICITIRVNLLAHMLDFVKRKKFVFFIILLATLIQTISEDPLFHFISIFIFTILVESIFNLGIKKKSLVMFILAMSLIVTVSVCLSPYGVSMARNQDKFYKINGREDVIGVRQYGDCIIAKKIDDKTLAYTETIDISDGATIEIIESREFKESAASYYSSISNDKDYYVLNMILDCCGL